MSNEQLKSKVDFITAKIPLEENVIYDGKEYLPIAMIKKYTKEGWLYSVRLKDLKSNSIIEARVVDCE